MRRFIALLTVLFFAAAIQLFSIGFLESSLLIKKVDAHQSGCHRWHTCPSDTGSYEMEYRSNGTPIQYCGNSMYMGTDGHCHYYSTPSTSPAITPSYSIPSISIPLLKSCSEFGLGATYNSVTEKCECMYGYVARNNKCISNDDACEEDYGINARSSYGEKCECEYGYKFNHSGKKCISNLDYCKEIDRNADYDLLTDSCSCKSGYVVDSNGTSCVLEKKNAVDTYFKSYSSTTKISCPAHSKVDILKAYSCICDSGYQFNSDRSKCVTKNESNTTSSIDCGGNAYYTMSSGCRCKSGYSGPGCSFTGCPVGAKLNKHGDCEINTSAKKTSCLTNRPCTCPDGYGPKGNRICVSL